MIVKMRSGEQRRLGLSGIPGTDYVVHKDIVEILPAGAFLLDNPEQKVDVARPGDVVVIWSNASIYPDRTIGAATVNPKLARAGFVSFPPLYTERSGGPVSVLFRCEQEIDLKNLGHLLEVCSLGLAHQN